MCYLMLLRESRLTGSSEAPIELVWKLSARFGAVFKIRSNLGRVEGTGFHLRRSSWLKRELNLPGSFPFSVLKGVALTDNKMNIQARVCRPRPAAAVRRKERFEIFEVTFNATRCGWSSTHPRSHAKP